MLDYLHKIEPKDLPKVHWHVTDTLELIFIIILIGLFVSLLV